MDPNCTPSLTAEDMKPHIRFSEIFKAIRDCVEEVKGGGGTLYSPAIIKHCSQWPEDIVRIHLQVMFNRGELRTREDEIEHAHEILPGHNW